MIGDTSHDMHMARAAKVRGLGVTWGFHERHEVEDGEPHEIVDDFAAPNMALNQFAS